MTEPEKPSPESAEAAVGPPAAAALGDAAAPSPPADGGAPAAETAAPAEPAPPPELTEEEEGKRLEEFWPKQRQLQDEEGKRNISARLLKLAQLRKAAEPPPRELTEKERIEEAKAQETEKARLEELKLRELLRQRQLEEEQGKRIISSNLLKLAQYQKEEIQGLQQQSLELQKRVAALAKKRQSVHAGTLVFEGQDEKYYACLTKWNALKYEFGKMKEDLDKKIDHLRYKLYEKSDESNARHEGLIYYLWKIARDSQDIVSFQGIPRRVLHELEQEERDSIAELQAVRTAGRAMKKQLGKLGQRLALKDRLKTDTHGELLLVAYENLQYDNEVLHKKIRAKDEQISGLKEKTAIMVHTLQHFREKTQWLVVECEERGQESKNLGKALHGGRIKTSLLKTSILTINRKRNALTKGVVSITSPMIWDDMEYQQQDIEAEEQTFQELKKRYHHLTMKIQEFRIRLYDLHAPPNEFQGILPRKNPWSAAPK